MLAPLYTPENCRYAYQLNWQLTLFWRNVAPPDVLWLEELKAATEPDGIRVLEHSQLSQLTSQFLVSTKPHVSPKQIIRSVKGRLQHHLRRQIPKCFRRNYFLGSVGSANSSAIDHYVQSQPEHHQMADCRLQQSVVEVQFHDPSVNLDHQRRTESGRFIYNLHIVLVYNERAVVVEQSTMSCMRDMVQRVSNRKGHRLSRIGIAADHLHFTVGCQIDQSPENVALAYLNNLAYSQQMKPIFQFGYYVGTFGPFDLGAVRRSVRMRS